MSPFSSYLQDLRKHYGISQRELASRIGYEQGFISNLELSRKRPNQEFLEKLIRRLGLNKEEVSKLYLAVNESQQRYVMPETAGINEYRLIHKLWANLGKLAPAQIKIIMEIIELPDQLIPASSGERGEGAKM